MLDRYEHVLLREQARYTPGSAAVTSLHADLAPARASFTTAAEQRKNVLPPNPNLGSEAMLRSIAAAAAAGAQHGPGPRSGPARRRTCTRSSATPTSPSTTSPVSKSVADTQSVLATYITDSLGHVADTRARLRDDHELVFKLDILVTQTKSHLGIEPGSIWALIITDHQAPTLDETHSRQCSRSSG